MARKLSSWRNYTGLPRVVYESTIRSSRRIVDFAATTAFVGSTGYVLDHLINGESSSHEHTRANQEQEPSTWDPSLPKQDGPTIAAEIAFASLALLLFGRKNSGSRYKR